MTVNDNSFENFVTKHKRIIFIILIFIMAFSIRGHLLKYDNMFEFDSYWHLRMTGYTLQGDLPTNDPLGFYAQGGTALGGWPSFLWHFTSIIYIIFTLGAPYNKELLMQFARFLPAIFGALISVAMYFLGKEIYNRKVGYVMAIVAATIPAFVYRTMAGFFEEDSLGFLWLVLGFLFLVKAIKHLHATKIHLRYAVISGLFFGLMAFTWAMFILVPIILISYFIGNMIYMAYKNYSNKDMAAFFKIFVIAFVLFVALASIAQPTWIKTTSKYVGDYIPITQSNLDRIENKNTSSTDVLGASVGEENVGRKFFLYKYSFLIWIPFAAILLMPLYLLFSKRKDYLTLLLFFWLLMTTFMAWSKLKFTFTLGLPLAAAAGFLFYFFDSWVENKSLFAKRVFAVFVGIVLLSSIAAGTHEVYSKVPQIVEKNDWSAAIFWIGDNTSQDAKIFNWWDYGHWITYFAERKASTDNTNVFIEADSDFGLFIINDDINATKTMMLKYDADYFIADNTYFNRYTSFGSYGYLTTNYNDPRISKYISVIFDCAVGNIADGTKAYKCNNNVFTDAQMLKIPTIWTESPSDVINGQPMFIYRLENNSKLIFLNAAANNSAFAKIWFLEPEYQKLFSVAYENGAVRVYKVNKDNLK